tara:strand:+ start:601 stop:924 length:324 start_codon:yes stop_codon:yes gene_type:complete
MKKKIDYKKFNEKQKEYKEDNKTNAGKFMHVSIWNQDDGSFSLKLNTQDSEGNYTTLFNGKYWENQNRTSDSQPSHTGNVFNVKEMDKLKAQCVEGASSSSDDDLPF